MMAASGDFVFCEDSYSGLWGNELPSGDIPDGAGESGGAQGMLSNEFADCLAVKYP